MHGFRKVMCKQNSPMLSEPFDQYINEKLREEITGSSRTTWWRLERQGKAPLAYRIGRVKRWLLSDILAWKQRRDVK